MYLLAALQISYTLPWIIMLSQLAYYSKVYGPQVGLMLTGCTADCVQTAMDAHALTASILQQGLWATGNTQHAWATNQATPQQS